MHLKDLDYYLPPELIARYPSEKREDARLLLLHRETGVIEHRSVKELPEIIPPDSLLVLNDTKVIQARLSAEKANSGGQVEVLLVEPVENDDDQSWQCMTRSSRPIRPGHVLTIGGEKFEVIDRDEDLAVIRFNKSAGHMDRFIRTHGDVPLPPYIDRATEPMDLERYQTVYAQNSGAVAAPTAGLHFSRSLMDAVIQAGHDICFITLHVGPGTFKPIKCENINEHRMDSERYIIPEKTADAINSASDAGRNVLAVGTTVVRALESAAITTGGAVKSGHGRTELFIRPGYKFKVVKTLMTNFHLPGSTLLCLLYAFTGAETAKKAYAEAVQSRYRFYSYGDSMLVI